MPRTQMTTTTTASTARKSRASAAPRKLSDAAPVVRSDMRQSIKDVATRLLTANGFNGTSFRDIAQELEITTTNIHYHFGNKHGLVDEVIRDYVAGAEMRHREIWLDPNRTLASKLRRLVEYNLERYQKFNAQRAGGNEWSLIGRMRLENSVLSENARATLWGFSTNLHEFIRQAVDDACRRGELREDAPRQDLAFLILNIVNSSSVFTHGLGGFDRLELFFDAFSRVMLSAYAGAGDADAGIDKGKPGRAKPRPQD